MPLTKDQELEYHTSIKEGRPEAQIGSPGSYPRGIWATEEDLEEVLRSLRARKIESQRREVRKIRDQREARLNKEGKI